MPFRFAVDLPRPSYSKTYGLIEIAGWCIDAAGRPARQVRARIGRQRVVCSAVDRPDVLARVRDPAPLQPEVGFYFRLPARRGHYIVRIEAELADGEVIPLRDCMVRVVTWPPAFTGVRGWWQAARRARKWRRPPGPEDSVLALVPVGPGTPSATVQRARDLAERALHGLAPSSRVVLDSRGAAPGRGAHLSRQVPLAAIRQGMIDDHLRDEKWVFWADVDLIDYPAHLVSTLIRRAENGIAAPFVLMADGTGSAYPRRFFDLAGFVENGNWADSMPPYFRQPGPVYRLDSVGCCYLVAADLYRLGARHEVDPLTRRWVESGTPPLPEHALPGQPGSLPLAYTEHYSVSAFARAHGRPVQAFADLVALHEPLIENAAGLSCDAPPLLRS